MAASSLPFSSESSIAHLSLAHSHSLDWDGHARGMQRYPPQGAALAPDPDQHRRQPSSSSTTSRAPTSPRIRSSGSRPPSTAYHPSSSSTDDDRWQPRPPPRKGSPSLPFYTPGGGPPGASRGARGFHAGLSGRLRGGRVRWVVLLAVAAGVLLWRSSGSGDDALAPVAVVEDESALRGAPVHTTALERPPRVDAVEPDARLKQRPPLRDEPAPAPPPPRPPPPAPRPPPSTSTGTGPVDVAVRPPSLVASSDPSSPFANRYLAYSPHSGYHNQRISLENALTLAFLLKRTLLLPPVWVGHAIPYISFDKLQRRLEMATKDGLEHCVAFGEGSTSDPIPRECDGFWDWTTVDWSFLVDLSGAEQLVPVQRRWNMSMDWLAVELDLAKPDRRGERRDVFSLRDDTMYQYRFYDSADDADPLDKWTSRIDIEQLARDSASHKLVHVGSMFGTNRLRLVGDDGYDARGTFRRAMVFRTEAVDAVADEVRDLLGGAGRYYGLHLRVGDGVFQQNADDNMRGVWDKLCGDKMKLGDDVCDEARGLSEARRRRDRRGEDGDDAAPEALAKRANSRPQREGAYHHAPLPPLPKIRTLDDSPLSPTLTCRRPLHTAAHLLPFNAPLFIATDSKLGVDDPHLALFFAAFPCTFTLSDFGALESLGRLNRLRNEDDKTPLAQFLYPQLDAQVAAWGRGLVGTPQSTYSRFAIDVLHQVYQCVPSLPLGRRGA